MSDRAETTADGVDVAVAHLRASLDSFGDALLGCLQVGLQPADALRAAGVDVPGYASPMVNSALSRYTEVAEGELQSDAG